MMAQPGGHKRRAGNIATLGDISAAIEMAKLEATEASASDQDPAAFVRGVETMRVKAREMFEEIWKIKLPKVEAVRKKNA